MENKKIVLKIVLALAVVIVIVIVGVIAVYSPQLTKPGEIKIETEKTEYQAGDSLKIKIENDLGKDICFSSCYPYYFEKKDGEWISYQYNNCLDSNLAGNCIKAKTAKAFEIIIPRIQTGAHRLALPACVGCGLQEKFREDQWLYSNDFVIK